MAAAVDSGLPLAYAENMKKRRGKPAHRIEKRRLNLSGSKARLAVVADTHSRPHPATTKLLAELKPQLILHAGDIGALEVLDELAAIAPVVAVRGNIDGRSQGLVDSVVLQLGTEPDLRILLTHIALYGATLRSDCAGRAKANDAQLVVCGHSHVPFVGRDKDLWVFNPGSIGPRRFTLPITLGLIEWSGEQLSFQHLDCETGQTWLPPGAAPRS